MLTLFLNLIDRLVKLVELRQADKRTLFKEIAEPLFIQLQPVVDDYFALFRRARVLVSKSNRYELAGAVEELRSQREKMLQARVAVTEFATSVETHVKEKHIAQFCQKIGRFFFSTRFIFRRMSGPAVLVELFDLVAKDTLDKEELLLYINDTLRALENSWIAIAQSYAHLRTYSMSPDRYFEEANEKHEISTIGNAVRDLSEPESPLHFEPSESEQRRPS